MNHRIRYLLFRIAKTVIFHVAWMDERLRSTSPDNDTEFTASNGVTIKSTSEGDGYPFAYIDSDQPEEEFSVEVRGGDVGADDRVCTTEMESEDDADRVISRINAAIAEWSMQPMRSLSDPSPLDPGPAGFPYHTA